MENNKKFYGEIFADIEQNNTLSKRLVRVILKGDFESFSAETYEEYRAYFENREMLYSVVAAETIEFLRIGKDMYALETNKSVQEIYRNLFHFMEVVEAYKQEEESVPKFVYQIYDYINVAIKQYYAFGKEEKGYEEVYCAKLAEKKPKLKKEINYQIIILVGIFIVLAFLIFAGVSGFVNFFVSIENNRLPKFFIAVTVGALYFWNILSLMLYYIAKLSKNSIASSEYQEKEVTEDFSCDSKQSESVESAKRKIPGMGLGKSFFVYRTLFEHSMALFEIYYCCLECVEVVFMKGILFLHNSILSNIIGLQLC